MSVDPVCSSIPLMDSRLTSRCQASSVLDMSFTVASVACVVMGILLSLSEETLSGKLESGSMTCAGLTSITLIWTLFCAARKEYAKAGKLLAATAVIAAAGVGMQGIRASETSFDTRVSRLSDAPQYQRIGKVFFFVLPTYDRTFFAHEDLWEKVKIFETAIHSATKLSARKEGKPIVIAPEDLLNPNPFSYHSHQEKDHFLERMIEISKTTHLIIAPGTFNWASEGKRGLEHYKSFYLFDGGQYRRYDKRFFFPSPEYGVLGEPGFGVSHARFESSIAKSLRFEGDPVLELGEITFGAEICFDTEKQVLERHLESHPQKIDVQLLVSDSMPVAWPVQQNSSFLLIHADTNEGYCQASIVGNSSSPMPDRVLFYNFSERRWFYRNLTTIERHERFSPSLVDQMFEERNRDLFIELSKEWKGNSIPPCPDGFFEWFAARGDFESAAMAMQKILSFNDPSKIKEYAYKYLLMLIDTQEEERVAIGTHHLLTAGIEQSYFAEIIDKAFSIRKQTALLLRTALALPHEKQNNALLKKIYNACCLTATKKISSEMRIDFSIRFLAALEKSRNAELASELKQILETASPAYFYSPLRFFA